MKILIIHDPRSDRHETLITELKSQSVNNADIVFIPPVYMDSPKMGISRAHKNAVLYAKENNLDRFVILENDIKFTCPDSLNYYIEGFKELPEDWEVYLGGAYNYSGKGKITQELMRVQNFSAFHMYSVNPKYFDKFECLKEDWHIDVALGFRARIYLRFPIPSIQHDGYSENWGKELKHERWTKKLTLYNGKNEITTKRTRRM